MRNFQELDLTSGGEDRHGRRERLLELLLAAERRRRQAVPTITQRERGEGPLPLSYAQERLWFLDQLGLVEAAYNIPMALSLRGKLDVNALERSFAELVRRHETLRTRFSVDRGVPHQLISEWGVFKLDQRDLGGLRDRAERERKLLELMQLEQRRPFDLGRGPLLRVVLVKLGHDEHALLLTMHHIISDGWSVGILNRELSALYSAYTRGEASPLPKLTVQYADYAIWQRRWLQGEVLQDQLRYWRKQLEGASSQLQLPTDRPRPAVETFNGATFKFELPVALCQALTELGRGERATLFMVALAAFNILLSRWSGEQDILIGTPIAGRRQQEVEGLIGFFINTLVLRTDLTGAPPFRQLLGQVREMTLGAYAHQDLPFETLVKELRPERDLARQPLFQVMMVLQNYPQEHLELPGLTWTWNSTEPASTHFDLSLNLYETSGMLAGVFLYAADLFDRQTIERMAGNFRVLLEAIVANPDCAINRLPVLRDLERRQLLSEWNATAAPYPQDCLIHELFEQQVSRVPDAIAVADGDRTLTYRELNSRANRLARCLIDKGVRPDRLVALYLERSVEMIVAMLGVLKAGGAYVPLDPGNPGERLEHLLTDAKPQLLLTLETLRRSLPVTGCEALLLDGDWEQIARHSDANPQARSTGAHCGHLAYVIYTSGSTGKPKGVMVTHRNVVNYAVHAHRQFDISDGAGSLVCSSMSFDLALTGLYPTLLGGKPVRLCPEQQGLPDLAEELLRCSDLAPLKLTPSHLALLEHPLRNGELEGRVRVLVLGGEPLHASKVQLWKKYAPGTRVFNHYGPTEATIGCVVNEVGEISGGTVPIGRPIANTQIYVLDRHLQPVPVGVVGEIYIAGAGVARGYLNQPQLTAERFIANPFSADPAARMYKSGDLGRWLPDGAIECLGRNDHQIKIRGHRIELGEIQTLLAQHEQVKGAVVLAREDAPGDKRLVGYIVPNRTSASAPASEGVRESLRRHIESEWQAAHQDIYETSPTHGPSFIGWSSSYTGQPLPEVEMQEWLTGTIDRIQALQPKRVLEIGCGVGLLLEQLAPGCERYVATDLAEAALGQLREWTRQRPGYEHVELLHRSACDLGDLQPGSFDTIVLSSVVQYFPDIDYLLAVLQAAVRLAAPGGKIFFGDIRHLGSLPTFHSAVQLGKAAAKVTVEQLRKRIQRTLSQEKQLVIDPGFFEALPGRLPGIGAVEVHLKRGRWPNELNRHRYDAIVHVGEPSSSSVAHEQLQWGADVSSMTELGRALKTRRWRAVQVCSIPDARLAREVAAQRLIETSDGDVEIGVIRRQLNELSLEGCEPETVWECAAAHHYQVAIVPGQHGCFDVRLIDGQQRHPLPAAVKSAPDERKPWAAYANDPLESASGPQLIRQLREYLQQRLPEYMIPSAWMLLKELPLTANGKLDRRALPNPQLRPEEMGEYIAARTDVERELAEIWAALLQVDQVGIRDNFFELGGHSMHSIRLIAGIAERFGARLPVLAVFQHPTVEQMAAAIESLRPSASHALESAVSEFEEGVL